MASERHSGGTRATAVLTAAGIDYELLRYDPATFVDAPDGTLGGRAAAALDLDPATVFKTLIVDVDGRLAVAVVPVDRHLDLKVTAIVSGAKRAVMAVPRAAERSTGYVTGGISPIGQRKALRTFIDCSAKELPGMVVNAGRRGLMLRLAPIDLCNLTGAEWASIAR